MSRPANPEVRGRLLAAGLELMYASGFNGTGVKEVTDKAGIPKGSFYSYFASKELFAVAVVRDYWAHVVRDHGPLLAAGAEPVDRLRGYFHSLADEHAEHDFALGCLIGNLALETAGTSEHVSRLLRTIMHDWEMAVAACLADEASAGYDLAATIIEAWEGAVLRGKVERSRTPYDRFEAFVLPRLLAGRTAAAAS
jgi:TetR/AcrR family transcriptional regulator, transcriptional repressor for nem operon